MASSIRNKANVFFAKANHVRLPKYSKNKEFVNVFGDDLINSPLDQIPALFQSVNADGWSVTYASPPTFDPAGDPEAFTVSRAGYDATGAAATITENLICTQRVRLPFPDQATLSADRVALSDYIYSTDTIADVTNNSTEVSPKPIVNWARPQGAVVGDSFPASALEIVALHRNGIACAEWTISDGTNSVTVRSTAMVVSGASTDRNAVLVYRPAADVDVSSLANPATLTVNAKAYPRIGESASIADSADSAVARGFSPRTFLRSTSLAASPVYVYVAVSGGNDTTGAVSTNAATAEATPCATIGGAINRLVAVNGSVAGCIIRLLAGTHTLNSTGISTTRAQGAGELVITRDPNASKSSVILQYGGVAFRPRLGASGGRLRIADLTLNRTSTTQMMGEAASQLVVIWDGLTLDAGSVNASFWGSNSQGGFIGCEFSNLANSSLSAGAQETRIIRGCTGSPTSNVEGWLVLGCDWSNLPAAFAFGSRSATGAIIAFNECLRVQATSGFLNIAAAAAVSQMAVIQNVCEFVSATAGASLLISADSATGNTTHIIVHHNTFTGFFSNGRSNIFYDEGATARTSKLMSVIGNIHGRINTKSDVFQSNGARVGNWAYLYGVGCQGEFSQFIDASNGGIGTSLAQAYPGLRASIGTSNSTRNDPLFTDYEGTTSGPTAGAGGGDYTIASGSPAKARVAQVLPFDLAGNPRGELASAGAYE